MTKGPRADFSLRQVEVFCQVAEQRSFSKAANAVFLSQPTVSEHMAALERSLGARLFDRVRGAVALTSAGKMFYEHAKKLLSVQNEAVRSLDDMRGAVRGTLEIGGSTIPGTYVLPGLIKTFLKDRPEIRVVVRTGDSSDILDMLDRGTIEAGLVGSKVRRRGIEALEIARDDLVLIVPPGHKWAKRRSVPVASLGEESFVNRERGSGTREAMEGQLAAAGAGPLNVRVEVGSTEAVKEAVKAGLGVSIVSRRAVQTEAAAGALAAVKVEGVDLSRELVLVTSTERTRSGICAAFLDHVRASAGSL